MNIIYDEPLIYTRWIRFSRKCYPRDYSNIDHHDLITDSEYKKLEETNVWVTFKDSVFQIYASYSNINFPDEIPHLRHCNYYLILNKTDNMESVAKLILSCFNKFHNPLWYKSYIHIYTHVISWDYVLNNGRIAWEDNIEENFSKKLILKRLKQELFDIHEHVSQNYHKIKDNNNLLTSINQLPYIARSSREKYHILI